ncbi:MAG: hypothetical protein HHJ16_13450 [Polaromonas sp.]|uniref:hypothetical protein n=1 Tax=Polaromonas sp. TaxID=1869339 RepID=UPI0017CF2673|nr:hypothetical protein [Polaromonas sp.]NMM11262.1 hypothetical protein [Polaromonas sp.]
MDIDEDIIHPASLSVARWVNALALAVAVLVMSGWKIDNATVFLGSLSPLEYRASLGLTA